MLQYRWVKCKKERLETEIERGMISKKLKMFDREKKKVGVIKFGKIFLFIKY